MFIVPVDVVVEVEVDVVLEVVAVVVVEAVVVVVSEDELIVEGAVSGTEDELNPGTKINI